jgi:predicted nucleotidyltransferase
VPTADQRSPSALEGAAVETAAGLIFTVKGITHPPDRVVAYLRYVPDQRGDRVRDQKRYRRVYSVAEQQEALQARGLLYVTDDPDLGVPVEAVPWRDVTRVYDPRERFRRLRAEGPDDPLAADALGLLELLRDAAGVSPEALGLTGSLLFDLHAASSDIDVVVYGEDACRAVHAALGRLLGDPSSGVARPDRDELAAIHAVHRVETPLSPADFARLQAGKVNEGRFAGRPYFARFVKLPADVPERYGDPRFLAVGMAVVEALVIDDRDALFTPCRYAVGEAKSLAGIHLHGLREVVSFRGRFADQARAGQRVRALGEVERVVWRDRPETTRLVVGGRPGDYLLALEDEGAAPGAGHSGEPGLGERAVPRATDDGPGCSPQGAQPGP